MHFIKILIKDDSGKVLYNSLITWKYLCVSSSQRAAVYFHSVKTITVLSSTQRIYVKKKKKKNWSPKLCLGYFAYRREEKPMIRGDKALRGVFHVLTQLWEAGVAGNCGTVVKNPPAMQEM